MRFYTDILLLLAISNLVASLPVANRILEPADILKREAEPVYILKREAEPANIVARAPIAAPVSKAAAGGGWTWFNWLKPRGEDLSWTWFNGPKKRGQALSWTWFNGP